MRQGPNQPRNTTLHLASSLDEVSAHIAAILPRGRLVVIETARLAEGRSFAPGEPLPFEEQSFEVTLCDLKNETPKSFQALLAGAIGCVLLGGNTFCLMEALENAHFDDAVRQRTQNGGPIFHVIGESAGAVVMGTTIGHVASMDDPSLASRDISQGLGWMNARVLPHRGCQKWGFGAAVEKIIDIDADPESLMIIDESGLYLSAAR